MPRHPVDLLSGALGVLAVAAGLLVMTDGLGSVDRNGGWWVALAALVIGLGLIPWNRRRTPAPVDGQPTAQVDVSNFDPSTIHEIDIQRSRES